MMKNVEFCRYAGNDTPYTDGKIVRDVISKLEVE